MKIFISWSGERSNALALALREWLPLVLHYIDPWLSQADIDAGDRWSVEIAKELDACSFGVTCVTAENVSSPWILFEAGALAKSMEKGRVLPLLLDLDVREISGPLAQFQAKKAEREGLFDTILSLNKNSAAPEPEDRVKALFEALWPQLDVKIAEIPKKATPSKQARSQSEILEELVTSVRNLDNRYRDDEMSLRGPRGSKRAHMRAIMADELMHRSVDGPADPINILVAASQYREEFPWVYQLATEMYDALKGKNKQSVHRAASRLQDAVQMIARGPFSSEFEDRNFYMMAKTIDRLVSISDGMMSGEKSQKPRGTVKLV